MSSGDLTLLSMIDKINIMNNGINEGEDNNYDELKALFEVF